MIAGTTWAQALLPARGEVHVRDNADLTFFLAMQVLPLLPGPGVVALEGDGAIRHVALKAVPADLMARLGR